MHELSLSSAIVNTAARHASGRRVSLVSLRVGQLRQVVPETLAFYFSLVARDTVCEDARLAQELVEAKLLCLACDYVWAIESPAFHCPVCGGAEVSVNSGEEFEVESIEVEEEPCIARR